MADNSIRTFQSQDSRERVDIVVSQTDGEEKPASILAPKIIGLVDDALLRIFGFCTPTRLNSVIEGSDHTPFDHRAPDNVARVCRSWRNLVLSSPDLWATINIPSHNPTDATLKAMELYVQRCLQRSNKKLLECFIRLEGTFNAFLSRRIVDILSEHQGRWETVYIKTGQSISSQQTLVQDDEEDAHAEEDWGPVPPTNLYSQELRHLKALQLGFVGQYSLCSSRDATPLSSDLDAETSLSSIPSLTSLHLHMPRAVDAINWSSRTPNLQELHLLFDSALSHRDVSGISSDIQMMLRQEALITLPNLRVLTIGESGALIMSIGLLLSRLVCPELLMLDMSFSRSVIGYPFLARFLMQSRPKYLVMHLVDQDTSDERDARWLGALTTAVPRMVDFTYSCHDVGPLLELLMPIWDNDEDASPTGADSMTFFTYLPMLMKLRLASARVPLTRFIELIALRWNVHKTQRSLKSVVLLNCITETGEELPRFAVGDDPARLPGEWDVVKQCIAQGLELQITPPYTCHWH